MIPLARTRALDLADGTSTRQKLTHQALVDFSIDSHTEQILCYVADLHLYDVILGMPWFEIHNPGVDWPTRQLTLDSTYCFSNCLQGEAVVAIGRGGLRIPPERGLPRSREEALRSPSSLNVKTVSADAFSRIMLREGAETYLLMPRDLDETVTEESLLAISPADYEQYMKGKEPLSLEQIKEILPVEFHDYADVFLQREADSLPPRRPGKDHEIRIVEGAAPPFRKGRPMGREELLAVKKHIDEMCAKGFARPASSPYSAPMLVVRKPGGGLRICIDYRALNALTIKNRFPIPLINETLDRLCKARFFTTLDVIAAFNRVRMKEEDIEKTAFNSRYGQFEYIVMPFGLCNAPGTFQSLINDSIREYLDDFASAYLDDILCYSNTREEHVKHVRKVLQRMRENNLQLDIRKSCFMAQEVKYLGMYVGTNGLRMDPTKVEAVTNWRTPRSVKDVQAFLGFANFYRRFIQGFSKLAAPLTNQTKGPKDDKTKQPLHWSTECQTAFDALKAAFTSAPILAHFDPDRESWVETDASDYVAAATLSQKDDSGILRPVAYLSSKMTPQEINYEIYDKELLAIVKAFEKWRPELMSTKEGNPVNVLSDHKNLEWFMTTKDLNRRQARWAEFLSQFHFKITYRPGVQSTKPDSLTRRSQDLPDNENDPRLLHQQQIVLKSHNIEPGMVRAVSLSTSLVQTEDDEMDDQSLLPPEAQTQDEENDPAIDLKALIDRAYRADDDIQEVMRLSLAGERRIPARLIAKGLKLSMADLEVRDNRLYAYGKLYVPEDQELRDTLIRLHHNDPVAGHGSIRSTFALLFRNYFWSTMTQDTREKVTACRGCKRARPFTEQKQGLLRPLKPPFEKWRHLTMDFAEDLPACRRNGRVYHHILVVVDRNSKGRRFAPLASLRVEDVLDAFRRHVIAYDGWPETIVCDRGQSWMAKFWDRLMQRRGTRIKPTTAFHPETDGQSENAVKMIKQYLRYYVNYDEDNWVDYLPEAQLVANNHVNESTGLTPYFVDRGQHPRLGFEPPAAFAEDGRIEQIRADKLVEKLAAIQDYLQQSLTWAQAKQAEYANRSRQPAPAYQVGDKVWLDTRNLKVKAGRTSRLGNKNEGPFKISRVIHNGSAYELQLPSTLQVHNVFHPWLLHQECTTGPTDVRDAPVASELVRREEDDEAVEEWPVEEIVNARLFGTKLKYKAVYPGHHEWNLRPEWQPWEDFIGCAGKIADFHHRHPNKPGPWPGFTAPEDWEPPENRVLLASIAELESKDDDGMIGWDSVSSGKSELAGARVIEGGGDVTASPQAPLAHQDGLSAII